VKGEAPSTAMPPLAAPAAAGRLTSPPRVTETAVSLTGGAGQELYVDDYLVGVLPCLVPRLGCRLLVSWIT
jgi:hypothetical protein